MDDSFQTDVIRSKLTQNIAVTFKEVREELFMAMDDFIPMSSDGTWKGSERKGHDPQGTQSGSRSPF
jgi:hypothetical protein